MRGKNTHAQLGAGPDDACPIGLVFIGLERCRAVPSAVPGVTGVKRISVGDDHTCALHDDGTVSCWGFDVKGQIDGHAEEANRGPTRMSGVEGAMVRGSRS